jgi:hypothetical protein
MLFMASHFHVICKEHIMSPNRRSYRFWLSSGTASVAVLIVLLSLYMSVSAQTEPQPLPPVAIQGAELVADAAAFNTVSLSSLPPTPVDYTGPTIDRSRGQTDQTVLDLPHAAGGQMVEAADPLAAQQIAAPEQQQRVFSSKLLNIDGQGFTGVTPSDNVGDVGLTEYVQLVNGPDGARIAVYNKLTGALIGGPITIGEFLAPTDSNCRLNAVGDPTMIFDPYAKRWIIVEVAEEPSALCVYVSQTNSATGFYNFYRFPMPAHPRAPKLSVWHDAYYVTASEASSSVSSTPVIYALERSDMLIGEDAKALRVGLVGLEGFDFQTLTPADPDGLVMPPISEPAPFLRHVDDELHNNSPVLGQDYLELWQYKPNFAVPNDSLLIGPTHISVADFDSEFCASFFACIPQPATSTLLDPVLEPVAWRLQYRNFGSYQTMVGSFTVGDLDVEAADRAAVRWFELRRTSGGWGVQQQGTFTGADIKHRWISTIAMDRFGNIALGYNASDDTLTFPSAYYTGREADDAAGIMTQGDILVQSGSSSLSASPWGEYNSLNVDPVDDCTFYYTANYAKGGQWATRLSSFRFEDCVGLPVPTLTPSPTITAIPPTATIAPVAIDLIQNGGFEGRDTQGSASLVPWSLSKGDKDKIKCDKPLQGKFFARSGECAFMFKGIEGEASKLKQTYPGTNTFFIAGDVIALNVYFNAPKSALDMKAKLKVSYEDPNVQTGKNTITLAPTDGDYVFRTTSYTLINDFVSKIKVIFDHRTTGGKVFVDDTTLIWNQLAARRTRGARPSIELIPLP